MQTKVFSEMKSVLECLDAHLGHVRCMLEHVMATSGELEESWKALGGVLEASWRCFGHLWWHLGGFLEALFNLLSVTGEIIKKYWKNNGFHRFWRSGGGQNETNLVKGGAKLG